MDDEKNKRLDADHAYLTDKIKALEESMSTMKHWHNGALEAISAQVADEALAGITKAATSGRSPGEAVRNITFNLTQMFFFMGWEAAKEGHDLVECDCEQIVIDNQGDIVAALLKAAEALDAEADYIESKNDLPGNYL